MSHDKPSISFSQQVQQTDLAHWTDLQTRIGDVTTAKLIVQFLNAQHPNFQSAHMGVYLRARETVKRHRVRRAKRYRAGLVIGKTVRAVAKVVRFACRVFLKAGRFVVTDLPLNPPPAAPVVQPAMPVKPAAQEQVWPVLFDPIDHPQHMH